MAQIERAPGTLDPAPGPTQPKSRQELLDEALDKALADTFPASDAIAVLEPVPEDPRPRPRRH